MEEKRTLTAEDFRFVNRHPKAEIDENYASQSYGRDVLARLCANKGAIIGFVLIVLVMLFAIVAPMISGYTYKDVNAAATNLPPKIPGLEKLGIFDGTLNGVDVYAQKGIEEYHYFGTDNLGRDIFTRVGEGTRISLMIAFLSITVNLLIGVVYGLISGYFGGWVDNVMQRFIEILVGIPSMVILTLLLLVMKPGIASIVIALTITSWVNMSRIVRAQVLKLKNQEFVLASKTLGTPSLRIVRKDMLPNAFGQIIITFTFSIPDAIFLEAFLAFIGLGVQEPMASLGSLINTGYKCAVTFSYMIVAPVVMLAILMLSFTVLGDGLRDAIDPQMKEQ